MRLLSIICFSAFTLSSHAQGLPSWMLHALGVHGDPAQEADVDSVLYQTNESLHTTRNQFIGTFSVTARYGPHAPTSIVEGWNEAARTVVTVQEPDGDPVFYLADLRAGVVLWASGGAPENEVVIEHMDEGTDKEMNERGRFDYWEPESEPEMGVRRIHGHTCTAWSFVRIDTLISWNHRQTPSPFADIAGWLPNAPHPFLELSMVADHTTMLIESKNWEIAVKAIKPGHSPLPHVDLSAYEIYEVDETSRDETRWERSATGDGLVPYEVHLAEEVQVEMLPDPLSIDRRFPGGEQAMDEYIQKAIQYPPAARKAGIHGTVNVRCLVDASGLIFSTRIDYGVSPELDAEALRVVKTIPRLEPATGYGDDGVMVLSVNFELP